MNESVLNGVLDIIAATTEFITHISTRIAPVLLRNSPLSALQRAVQFIDKSGAKYVSR